MSERIKIAVVGLHFGRAIVEDLLKPPASDLFDLTTLCDRVPEVAKDAVETYHVPSVPDLSDILNDPSIKAVALMTPPGSRAELIRRIIRTGRHVMTTKPFERDTKAARDILNEAKSLGMAVHLNSPSIVRSPLLEQVEQWRKQYDLGIPVGIRADMWAHKPKPADGSWYDDPVKCPAAPIYRIGIYLINEIVELFGEASKASVLSSRLITGRPTPDNAQLSLLFKNGALGNVFVSFCVKDSLDHRHMFTINFEKGTIYANVGPTAAENPETATELRLIRFSGKKWAPLEERAVLRHANSYAWRAFYDAVNGNDAADDHYRDRIVWGLEVIDAMARAEQSGKIELVSR